MQDCPYEIGSFKKTLLFESGNLQLYLSSKPDIVSCFAQIKSLHWFGSHGLTSSQASSASDIADELLVDGFSNEQIWQQRKAAAAECLESCDKVIVQCVRGLGKRNRAVDDSEPVSKKARVEKLEAADEDEIDSDDDRMASIRNKWLSESRSDDSMEDDDDDEEDDSVQKKEAGHPLEEDELSDDDDPAEILKKSLHGNHHKKKSSSKQADNKVDDNFFKLHEMNAFADEMERKEQRGVSANDDETDVSDESEEEAMYTDFFDEIDTKHDGTDGNEDSDTSENNDISKQDVEDDDDDDDDEDNEDDDDDEEENEAEGEDEEESDEDYDEDENMKNSNDEILKRDTLKNEPKSVYELNQELLQKQIAKAEETNLGERPWQLRGEVTGDDRPENSLLSVHLNYKFNSAPALSENENVPSIENLLKKIYKKPDAYIINTTKKVKPINAPLSFRKEIIIDQEKSKLGLAEVYEKEYLGQSQKTSNEEEKKYKECRKIMDDLFLWIKSPFSFGLPTVKPPEPKIQILENESAAGKEDVAPICVSVADRMTAEEILDKKRGALIGTTEKTKSQKNHERRLKLKHRKQRFAEKKARAAANPDSKEAQDLAKKAALKSLKKIGQNTKRVTIHQDDNKKKSKASSKDFFNKLQNQVIPDFQKKKESKKNANKGQK